MSLIALVKYLDKCEEKGQKPTSAGLATAVAMANSAEKAEMVRFAQRLGDGTDKSVFANFGDEFPLMAAEPAFITRLDKLQESLGTSEGMETLAAIPGLLSTMNLPLVTNDPDPSKDRPANEPLNFRF